MTISLQLANAGLILVDIQNDFLHPDGIFARKGLTNLSADELAAFVTNTQSLIDHMHSQGRPVVVVKTAFRPDFLDCAFGPEWAERSLGETNGFLIEGTWGAELIDGISLDSNDLVITKKGHGAFSGTFLDRFLTNAGVEQCILAGGPRASSLSDTTRHGGALGYDMFVVKDAAYPFDTTYRFGTSQAQMTTTADVLSLSAAPDAGSLYRKDRSALLVIDMQNHFLYKTPEKAAEIQRTNGPNEQAAKNVVRLAASFREQGIPIFWVKVGRRQDRMDVGIHRARSEEQPDEEAELLDDTWGSEMPELLSAHDGDFILLKRGNSAFEATQLHRTLRNLGVTHCYVAGGATGGCVSSTIRTGSALGYEVTIVADGTYPAQSPYLDVLATYGPVMQTDEILAQVSPTPMIQA